MECQKRQYRLSFVLHLFLSYFMPHPPGGVLPPLLCALKLRRSCDGLKSWAIVAKTPLTLSFLQTLMTFAFSKMLKVTLFMFYTPFCLMRVFYPFPILYK